MVKVQLAARLTSGTVNKYLPFVRDISRFNVLSILNDALSSVLDLSMYKGFAVVSNVPLYIVSSVLTSSTMLPSPTYPKP